MTVKPLSSLFCSARAAAGGDWACETEKGTKAASAKKAANRCRSCFIESSDSKKRRNVQFLPQKTCSDPGARGLARAKLFRQPQQNNRQTDQQEPKHAGRTRTQELVRSLVDRPAQDRLR